MPPCITKRHLFNHCIARIQQDVVDFATSWLLTVLYTSLTIHVYSSFTIYLVSRYLYLLASWLAIFFFAAAGCGLSDWADVSLYRKPKMQIHLQMQKALNKECRYINHMKRAAETNAPTTTTSLMTFFFFLGIFKCCFVERVLITGWRRLIRSPKLHIIFHKRAAEYRALLLKMTYEDKGSYESSPPCTFATWMTWMAWMTNGHVTFENDSFFQELCVIVMPCL